MLDIFEHQSWTKELTHELTDLWNLCEKREEQELLKSLIKDFCIFDAKMEKQAQIAIDNKVQELGFPPFEGGEVCQRLMSAALTPRPSGVAVQ